MTKDKKNEKKDIKSEDSEDFAKLLKKDLIKIPQVGDIVTGTVLSASKSEVRLDIAGITTGIVRGRELYHEAEEYANLKPEDEIEATVIEEENENGELELSFKYAGQQKAWANLMDAYKNKKIIKVKIEDANKGGLLINFGQITGFLPVSQLAPEHYPRVNGGDRGKILEKLRSFIGKEIEIKIVTLEQKDEKLIVSEREAWQEKQKDIITKYKVGSTVESKITAITDFGVFVTFGEDLEGLIHISELAWQRIDNPSSLFKVGDKVKAEIISIDGSKIFLSAKKLKKDPWKEVAKKYKKGQKVTGTILKINPFGLFIELDEEIHGLAHVSQLNLDPGKRIKDLFKPGDKQKFTIVSIEPEEHRLGLIVDPSIKLRTGEEKASARVEQVVNSKENIEKSVKKENDKKSTLARSGANLPAQAGVSAGKEASASADATADKPKGKEDKKTKAVKGGKKVENKDTSNNSAQSKKKIKK